MAERTNEQQWVQIRDILDIVGENGMSGDKTDEEACSPPFYFCVKTVQKKHIEWISKGLSALFYTVDSYSIITETIIQRGRYLPRNPHDPKKAQEYVPIIPGLPQNFYSNEYLAHLSEARRDELSMIKDVELPVLVSTVCFYHLNPPVLIS